MKKTKQTEQRIFFQFGQFKLEINNPTAITKDVVKLAIIGAIGLVLLQFLVIALALYFHIDLTTYLRQ